MTTFWRRRSAPSATERSEPSLVGYSDDPRGWDPGRSTLISPLTAEGARAHHLGGRTYSVVERHPRAIVVVTLVNRHEAKVTRYDPAAVEVREFREVEGRMWLRGIKLTRGSSATDPQPVVDWFTWVRPDTTATWTRFDARSPQGREHARMTGWPVELHWFERPAFGDCSDLVGADDLLERAWPGATSIDLTSPT